MNGPACQKCYGCGCRVISSGGKLIITSKICRACDGRGTPLKNS